MIRINGDLIPIASGLAHLGVNGGGNEGELFDHTTITPFGQVHLNSGVFHDPRAGQSGVMRFSHAAGAFQVSVDGGITFNSLSAGAGVDSVGVLGDTNLTGNIDLASPPSGFISIFDTSDASPIQFAVDTQGLSGLWGFPANGFPAQLARCHAENFSALSSTVTINHNIGTSDVQVSVYDNSSPRNEIIPDNIAITSTNVVTVTLNSPAAGRVVVIGCV